MTGAEVLVTLGGVLTITLLAWFFFGPRQARAAQIAGRAQEIEITVRGGHSPSVIRARTGVPLRLVFARQEAGDCTARVVFPDFGVSRTLPAFSRTTLEFTPDRAGEFGFACGMNMLHGTLIEDGEDAQAGVGERPRAAEAAEPTLAVGVGPKREVARTEVAEFAVLGGGVTCPTCAVTIESALKDVSGVDDVDVNFAAERVTVRYDPTQVAPEESERRVEAAGYAVARRPAPGTAETEDREAAERRQERRDLTRRVIAGAVLTVPVLFAVMGHELGRASWVPPALVSPWVQLALITPVMLYTGWPIHRTSSGSGY